MEQVEQATSKKGKKYLINNITTLEDVQAINISADNITSGTMSADRISGGTISANLITTGTLTTPIITGTNFSVDASGNMSCTNATVTGKIYMPNGGQIIGDDGVLSVFEYTFMGQQNAEYFSELGFAFGIGEYVPATLNVRAYIPSNFVITEAKILMYHRPMYIVNIPVVGSQWCYSRKIKVYKANTITGGYAAGMYGSEYYETGVTYSEIASAFGTNGFTATKPSVNPPSVPSNPTQLVTSADIKSSLIVGSDNNIILKSADTCSSEADMLTKTGQAIATLVVIGYKK